MERSNSKADCCSPAGQNHSRFGVKRSSTSSLRALRFSSREWQACVREAVASTSQAFAPGAPEIVCYIDKKAFKAPHRDALMSFVEHDLGLRTAMKPSQI